jgi:hypothetical protein
VVSSGLFKNQRIFLFLCALRALGGFSLLTTSQLDSVIAIAWKKHLLCETYSNTLRAVFDHLSITDQKEN